MSKSLYISVKELLDSLDEASDFVDQLPVLPGPETGKLRRAIADNLRDAQRKAVELLSLYVNA